ncbi:MAG TPA: SRPBCC family protein [Xanthobacteraceae bacterium]
MSEKFVYVTYIRTTPEKLWDALITPEFTRSYWCGTWQESDWAAGSSWRIMIPDGRVADSGEVLEIDRPRRLVLSWRNEFRPELKSEGFSRAAFDLERVGDTVKLTVTHEMERDGSKFIEAVSNGWPHILASLKSLLETGTPLAETTRWPADDACVSPR